MNTGPGLAPARLIALGSAALTEGFALIGFEARADPTLAAIEKLMQELQRNQQAALVVIEQSIARNPGRFCSVRSAKADALSSPRYRRYTCQAVTVREWKA